MGKYLNGITAREKYNKSAQYSPTVFYVFPVSNSIFQLHLLYHPQGVMHVFEIFATLPKNVAGNSRCITPFSFSHNVENANVCMNTNTVS